MEYKWYGPGRKNWPQVVAADRIFSCWMKSVGLELIFDRISGGPRWAVLDIFRRSLGGSLGEQVVFYQNMFCRNKNY